MSGQPASGFHWVDENHFEVSGVRFVAGAFAGSGADELVVIKPPDLVHQYLSLIEAERPRRIVELGVKEGGSTALLALVADPEILVAVDLEPEPPAPLVELLRARGLEDRVLLRTGVDQGDSVALSALVLDAFHGRPLDLVVDDASHLLVPTEVSFDLLFPMLRPGGTYVIEDWSVDYSTSCVVAAALPPTASDPAALIGKVRSLMALLNSPQAEVPTSVLQSITAAAADHPVDPTSENDSSGPGRLLHRIVEVAAVSDLDELPNPPRPLMDLGLKLMLAATAAPDLVADLRVTNHWLVVRRGPAAVAPGSFRLHDLVPDHFGYLG